MLQGQAVTHGVSNESVRKALFGSFFGTALEAYDFLLYGSAAGLVFNKLFFRVPIRLLGPCWLSQPLQWDGRPLPAVFADRYGSTEIGNRGGIMLPGVQMVAPMEAC